MAQNEKKGRRVKINACVVRHNQNEKRGKRKQESGISLRSQGKKKTKRRRKKPKTKKRRKKVRKDEERIWIPASWKSPKNGIPKHGVTFNLQKVPSE